ncbi:MAG: hypothetical protein RLZZ267_1016 [Bacillota bacterium]|jgi:uncharacterized protein (TIGR01777 family)
MKVVIAGGTGFIGGHLTNALMVAGHQVIHLSRRASDKGLVTTVSWEQLQQNPDQFGPVDAVVNLAGESINQRWTPAAKQRILQSRIHTTKAIATWVNQLEQKPKVVVNGSAIGYYGQSAEVTFDESSAQQPGDDFLTEVGRQWEAEADHIQGVRVVKLRTGLVLARDGGALPKMALPYSLFAGGPVGHGKQWYSWIHIQDFVRLILFAIENPAISGPLNGTAPHPVTNDQFGRTLGRVMRRPHFFPVPAFMLKLLFGEMSTILLDGQRVIPQKAITQQFQFDFPTLEQALTNLYD